MKTTLQQKSRLVSILLLAAMVGFLLLMHVTSGPQERCASDAVDISLLKLI